MKLLDMLRLLGSMVGKDILHYQQILAKTDVFVGKIKNQGFAFLPLARDVVREEDYYTILFSCILIFKDKVMS